MVSQMRVDVSKAFAHGYVVHIRTFSEEPDADHCSQCRQSIHEYSLMSAFLLQDSHSRRMQLQVYGEDAVRN